MRREEYVDDYNMIRNIIADGNTFDNVLWFEGHKGNSMAFYDAIHDAQKEGYDVLFTTWGSNANSRGALEASAPVNWRGWSSELLKSDAAWRQANDNYRPSIADIALATAAWVSEDVARADAYLAMTGHCGMCEYYALWVHKR